MRTNVDIDDELIQEAFRLTKLKTKKEIIHKALEEFIQNRKRLDLKEIRGKIKFARGYDYKKMIKSWRAISHSASVILSTWRYSRAVRAIKISGC